MALWHRLLWSYWLSLLFVGVRGIYVLPHEDHKCIRIVPFPARMKIVHVHWPKVTTVDGLFMANNGALRLQGKYEIHRPGVWVPLHMSGIWSGLIFKTTRSCHDGQSFLRLFFCISVFTMQATVWCFLSNDVKRNRQLNPKMCVFSQLNVPNLYFLLCSSRLWRLLNILN